MPDSSSIATQSNLLTPATTEVLQSDIVLHGYCRREQLAEQLGISTRTLDRLIASGDGPPRVKFGRTVLYSVDSVREWLKSREEKRKTPYSRPMAHRRSFAR